MSLPSFGDDFYILLDNRLNNCYLLLFETMIVNLLYRTYIILRLTIVLDNVHVNRIMVVRIEHESETKENEYCWHMMRI